MLLCALGADALAHGDLHEAIDAVTKVISSSPDDSALFLRRAELHRMHGDWAAAEADYATVRRLRPDLEVVKFCVARIRLAQGREQAAMQLLDGYLAKCPADSAAHAVRADLYDKRGDWQQADADLAAAVASSPEPHYATRRAELLEKHGQPAEAARCLDEASRAHGRVPVLEQQALEIEMRAGRADAALARLDGLIACEPRPDIWLARKAGLLDKTGRSGEAAVAWQQAAAAFEKGRPDRRDSKANRELAAQIADGLRGVAASSQEGRK